jgi:hypothetical protein
MNVQYASATIADDINSDGHVLDTSMNLTTGMYNPNGLTPLFVTGEYNQDNEKHFDDGDCL